MQLNKEILGNKYEEALSWDEYFMGIAKLSAGRSKDPNTRVGACIVDRDNKILSIGYNGAPIGFDDDIFPWNREGEKSYETKYPYVCHAELNAILNYKGSKSDLIDSKIYVDLFPCNECAKAIIQSGVKEVIYLSDKYKGTDENIASKLLLDTCHVKYRQLEEKHQKKLELSLKPNETIKYI